MDCTGSFIGSCLDVVKICKGQRYQEKTARRRRHADHPDGIRAAWLGRGNAAQKKKPATPAEASHGGNRRGKGRYSLRGSIAFAGANASALLHEAALLPLHLPSQVMCQFHKRLIHQSISASPKNPPRFPSSIVPTAYQPRMACTNASHAHRRLGDARNRRIASRTKRMNNCRPLFRATKQ